MEHSGGDDDDIDEAHGSDHLSVDTRTITMVLYVYHIISIKCALKHTPGWEPEIFRYGTPGIPFPGQKFPSTRFLESWQENKNNIRHALDASWYLYQEYLYIGSFLALQYLTIRPLLTRNSHRKISYTGKLRTGICSPAVLHTGDFPRPGNFRPGIFLYGEIS